MAAAAAAGRERGRWGLRLARVALSRGTEAARAREGFGGTALHSLLATRCTMGSAEDAVKEKLLWNVKKEVKLGQ